MLRFDIHLHTNRYSADSNIDPAVLIPRAHKAGLHGVVITEHHHQWTEEELADLIRDADVPGFICLSGFEYTTERGDLLVYGAEASTAKAIDPGAPPDEAAAFFTGRGAVCIAAHPTRSMGGFDERILNLPVAGIEAVSTRIATHETQLALKLAEGMNAPITIASDAHRPGEIGRYAMEFPGHVRSMPDLRAALQGGTFHAPF